ASGEPGEEEARLRRFDGEYRWFLFRAVPVRDEQGQIIRWYGTNADIEDRKRAESLLAAEKRTLEMMAGGASLKDTLENLCSAIDAQVPDSMSMVLLVDSDGKRMRPAAAPKVPVGWTEAITPMTIGPPLKTLVITSDIASDPVWKGYRDVALSNGVRACWSLPLVSRNQEALGTFAVYCAQPRSPSSGDVRIMEGASHIALIAIEGEQSRTALSQAIGEIRQSETQLRTIVDAIPTMAWRAHRNGDMEFLNQRWSGYTGLSSEQAQGWAWTVTIHPED